MANKMSLDWETFKTAMGSFCDSSRIVYIDEEGSEIPIESDVEFQEAIKLAKMNKNRLKLIFYDKTSPSSQKMIMTFPECIRIFAPGVEPAKNPKHSNENESTCCCGSSDAPPEWFIQCMKKFKEDIFQELRSSFLEKMNSLSEKEENLFQIKSDIVYYFEEKNKALNSLGKKEDISHIRRKKKVSDKDGVDLSEKRDLKLSKRLERLHLSKSDRLERLDNKIKLLVEERKKLFERERHLKSKLEKNNLVTSEKKNLSEKSASFSKNDVCFCLLPLESFTLNLKIKNNGKLPWSSPRLECYDVNSLFPCENSIPLPKLLPNENCVVKFKGTATTRKGFHHFKCRVIDEEKPIGPEFTCLAKVDRFKPYHNHCNVFVDLTKADGVVITPGEPVCSESDDLVKDELLATSQKKIEENILEIEKGLQFIDLLRPSNNAEESLKKTLEKTKKVFVENSEFQTDDYDSLQNLEEKDMNVEKRLEQEEVLFGVDCMRLDSETCEICEGKITPKTDENQQVGTDEKVEKDCELKSSSDSELSVIYMSEEEEEEEEENFIVVPLPSKSPSPVESMHEDQKCVNVDSEVKLTASQDQPEADVKQQPSNPAITIKIHTQLDKETSMTENLSPNEFSPTWSRRSPFGEEIPKSKPKKMKSKSTEYHFTTANLTQPTFTPFPDGFYVKRPSRFTFTGGSKEKPKGVFEFTFKAEKGRKKDDLKEKTVPKTDASGRIIYAVTKMGHCLPVSDVFENGEHSRMREENSEADNLGNQNRQEKQRYNEIPSVNILPNALMNGASNVASMAFNTAKSVINNLQSAFVTEGKTELGKPAYEDKKKVSMENMLKLYEMGFFDLQKNRNLLLIHDNDISRVIEELVRMEENSFKRSE